MSVRGRKNAVRAAILSAMAVLLWPAAETRAEAGWTRNAAGEWTYLNRENLPVTGVWKSSGESWYYLGEDGLMVKNRLITWRDGLYYLDGEGKMLSGAWALIEPEEAGEAAGEEAAWHYFGADGRGYRKKGRSFRKEIGGSHYAFDEDGRMLTGWIDEEGEPVEGSDPFAEARYYAGEDGALYTERWLNYGGIGTLDGAGGSSLQSEAGGRSYDDYPEMWLYFGVDSKKYRSRNGKVLEREIGGETYGFDENGVMLSWWSRIASISNAVKSNPTSTEAAKYYSGYDGGPLMKNRWLWMYPSEQLSPSDHIDLESSWWRTDGKGRVYRNRIREINGRKYAFDGIGRMQTGFVLFDGKKQFVAQYDVDEWSSDDFVGGNLYGLEKADLYLFSPDELNDGSMQSGKEIEVELADGIYTFGFGPNGKAYGNRNYLQKKDGRYYINGLRLEADEEYGYGVVKAERNGRDYYQVVDTQGKAVTGRRILRDGDGYLLVADGRFLAYCADEDAPKWRTGAEGTGFYHCDKSNKRDRYAGGLIAGSGTETDESGLPDEERLNF